MSSTDRSVSSDRPYRKPCRYAEDANWMLGQCRAVARALADLPDLDCEMDGPSVQALANFLECGLEHIQGHYELVERTGE